MSDFEQQILIGVILDIDSHIWLEKVKKELIKLCLNYEFGAIYISHPDNNQAPRNQGESVATISNYKKPIPLSIQQSVKTMVHLIGNQSKEIKKYACLISDCYDSRFDFHYKKGLKINESKNYKIKFQSICLGDKIFPNSVQFISPDNFSLDVIYERIKS